MINIYKLENGEYTTKAPENNIIEPLEQISCWYDLAYFCAFHDVDRPNVHALYNEINDNMQSGEYEKIVREYREEHPKDEEQYDADEPDVQIVDDVSDIPGVFDDFFYLYRDFIELVDDELELIYDRELQTESQDFDMHSVEAKLEEAKRTIEANPTKHTKPAGSDDKLENDTRDITRLVPIVIDEPEKKKEKKPDLTNPADYEDGRISSIAEAIKAANSKIKKEKKNKGKDKETPEKKDGSKERN